MKLVDDQFGYETNLIIINGNGTYPDLLILKRICEIYNGVDKIIVYPRTPLKRKSGLSALKKIYRYLDLGFHNFIFIVDREHISEDENIEIRRNLIGINILNEILLQNAIYLECRKGNRNFNLYCNIWGERNCIEEELLKLVELQRNIQTNILPVSRDANGRTHLKRELEKLASRRDIKKIIKESGRRKLETAFPNICAIFREIERNYEI